MVSFGGSKSKSKSKSQSESRTEFPRQFFSDAYGFFGGDPGYEPEYTGFEDFDKLESNLYGTQQAKISDAYDQAKKRRAEELSLAGLLNSPSRYIEGGVDDTLDKNMLSAIQQAARDAAMGRLGAQEREAGRKTEFSKDVATKLLNTWLQKLLLAAQAGRYSTGESTGSGGSSGFNFGLFNFGGSQSSDSSVSD